MLSPKRRKFASEYVKNGFNGVQAVFAAGYKQGYDSACTEAYRLLRIAEVRKRVEENLKASKMDADEVLERLAKIARLDAEFKGSDVVKANELLGKGHKLFTDKVETTSTTEQSHIVEQTILKRSKRTGEDAESIALSLLESFQDEPEFLQPEHWGKFAYVLAKPLESKEIQ